MDAINKFLTIGAKVIMVLLIAGVGILALMQIGDVILGSFSYGGVTQAQILLGIFYINLVFFLTYLARGIDGVHPLWWTVTD